MANRACQSPPGIAIARERSDASVVKNGALQGEETEDAVGMFDAGCQNCTHQFDSSIFVALHGGLVA